MRDVVLGTARTLEPRLNKQLLKRLDYSVICMCTRVSPVMMKATSCRADIEEILRMSAEHVESLAYITSSAMSLTGATVTRSKGGELPVLGISTYLVMFSLRTLPYLPLSSTVQPCKQSMPHMDEKKFTRKFESSTVLRIFLEHSATQRSQMMEP